MSHDEAFSWWRHAAVYQVYPRSFADSNGDGTGDVNGIRSKLGYLEDLGIDAIWISPWYRSPLNDGGYDVADYRDIDPRFGTLADAEALFRDAHDHNIRVLIDIVPNHTSSHHAWFQEALASGPGSPERDRYIFRPGAGADGSEPPNNWQSVFGGPAWSRVDVDDPDGEWYLHLFDPTQPDLNWHNPEVRDEFDSILKFWLERGADGFRIDVAHGLVKADGLPDLPEAESDRILGGAPVVNHPYWDQPGVHEIIKRWRAVLDDHERNSGREVMMVAEAWVLPESLPAYLRPDEYHQVFNFDFLQAEWGPTQARTAIDAGIDAASSVGSTSTWTLSNHDVMRHVTRLGLPVDTDWREWPLQGPADLLDVELGQRRALAATMQLLALPGSTYLYQGEELGLPDVWDLPPEVLDDPVWENSNHQTKGRDGCRVPMPWTPEGPSYGFGTAAGWLPQPAIYGELSAANQADVAGSWLNKYRTLLRLRRQYFVGDETFTWRDDIGTGDVIAFQRGSGVISITNYGDEPIEIPAGEILESSAPMLGSDSAPTLPPIATVWVKPS